MRVRIIKALPPILEGFDLARYRVDCVYDIGRSLSELLLLSGYAIPEEVPSEREEKAERGT